ncbi:hypothetical protein ACVILH_002206 [Bradyrhizobium sp. USDA 4353]
MQEMYVPEELQALRCFFEDEGVHYFATLLSAGVALQ